MIDDSNKYGRNRNLWRRVYSFRRRKPVNTQLVDAETGVTFSYDLQQILRHRDYFIIKTTATASAVIPPIPPPLLLGEYDEGLVFFNNTDSAVASFDTCFSDTPDAVVLSVEPSPNNDDFIIPYGITFNSCSMSIGLSAPYSGAVRYRAVYSSTGYPINVTSSLVPASGTFQVSAGHITASQATEFTASHPSGGSLDFFAKTAWDFFGNFDNNVFISEDNATSTSTSGSISAPLSNPIYFIAFF